MWLLQLLVIVHAAVMMLPEQTVASTRPSPIILIPGAMGSQLKVENDNKVCSTGHKYKQLWISFTRLLFHNACAKKELPLKYDANTSMFHNQTKVKISIPDFGGTSAVEHLNPGLLLNWIDYFSGMVDYFVDRKYKRGRSIRAAPYDWRLAADELERLGYYDRLKSLIEDTYNRNDQTKVTLVAHSMGGLVSLHFLTGFSGINQTWKDNYIHAFITLAAAWSGGAGTVPTVVSGHPGLPNLHFFNGLISRFVVPIAQTFESLPWLFPRASVFGEDKVIVSTPSKQYNCTANDYERLFHDINASNIYQVFQGVQALNPNYPAPNVSTYCYYGVGVDTSEKFTYRKDLTPGNHIGMRPIITYGDGDGSVNTVSAQVCLKWNSSMPHKFQHRAFNRVDHDGMLSNNDVLTAIGKIVRAPPKKKKSWFGKRK